ncbi:hypothetical protein D910_02264 [Dendroctonus ponderosae]|uniref:ABC transmembrane type-1 domain-containing protein n=1 Tax=Dendroctonus ponderosae TaxID=77166 RepID=U4U4G6_DENPD|nr:hypothetical protein D910_02264 [Dendroctonus ponderosae]
MLQGRIEAKGTFDELSNSNVDFTKLLAAADESNEEKENEPHHAIEEAKIILNRKLSTFSNAESVIEQTIRDDENEESVNYEGTTPFKDYLKGVGNICFVIFVILTTQEDLRYGEELTSNTSTLIQLQNLNTGSTISRIAYDDIFDEVNFNGTIYRLFKTEVSIYIYIAVIICAILFTVSRAMFFFKMAMKSSTNIHKKMFHCLLEAPMRFFDTNPSGRVLNRFSKDMGAIDEVLPRVLMDAVTIVLVMTGILINVAISNYYMIAAMLVLGYAFLKLRGWYIASAKDIKHLEGIAKSPVFSHITSTLNGLTTIRASQAEIPLIKEFDEHQLNVAKEDYLYIQSNNFAC